MKTVHHECQLCLWEAFLLFCLYCITFRMREACTGTHKVVDEVHLSLFIHVFVCVEGGMRLEK